jgi:hypothetical protein
MLRRVECMIRTPRVTCPSWIKTVCEDLAYNPFRSRALRTQNTRVLVDLVLGWYSTVAVSVRV